MPGEKIIARPNIDGEIEEIHESVPPEDADELLKKAQEADFALSQELLGKKVVPKAKPETPEEDNIINLPTKRGGLEEKSTETEAA